MVPPSRKASIVEFELWTTSTHLFISSTDLSFSLATPLIFAPPSNESSFLVQKYEEDVLDVMYNVTDHEVYHYALSMYIAFCADTKDNNYRGDSQSLEAFNENVKSNGTADFEHKTFTMHPVNSVVPPSAEMIQFASIERDPNRRFWAVLVKW